MATSEAERSRGADLLTAQAKALAKRVDGVAKQSGREDLREKLRAELARPPAAATTVVVCGETNRGKSALINALVGRPGLLPVAAERSTGTHVVVRSPGRTEQPGAFAHRSTGEPVEIALNELEDWVTEGAPIDRDVEWVEIVLDHPLLASGLKLVDSPGVGGLSRAHGQIALSVLSGAEAGILVVDAAAPVSAPELAFLERALERVDDLVVALNRIDSKHGWQEVMAESSALLSRHAGDRMDNSIFAVSARMKSRADKLRSSDDPGAVLADDLDRDSGVSALADRLGGWSGSRSGGLRAARLCRLGGQLIERLRLVEQETLVARDATEAELSERLHEKTEAREGLAKELPVIRRAQNNESRLLQREVDASLTRRVNALRRDFGDRLTKNEVDDLQNDLGAALVTVLEESLGEVRERLDQAEAKAGDDLQPFGVPLDLDLAELDWEPRPDLGVVEPSTVAGPSAQWGRVLTSAGVVVINPLVAVAALGGLAFDRRRMKKRAEQEQFMRQLTETIGEVRGQLSVAVHHAVVQGQSLLTEAIEQGALGRLADLDEEIAALKARAAQSRADRTQEASGVEERLKALDELTSQLHSTERAATDAMRGGAR